MIRCVIATGLRVAVVITGAGVLIVLLMELLLYIPVMIVHGSRGAGSRRVMASRNGSMAHRLLLRSLLSRVLRVHLRAVGDPLLMIRGCRLPRTSGAVGALLLLLITDRYLLLLLSTGHLNAVPIVDAGRCLVMIDALLEVVTGHRPVVR